MLSDFTLNFLPEALETTGINFSDQYQYLIFVCLMNLPSRVKTVNEATILQGSVKDPVWL